MATLKYSKWIAEEKRREKWTETVDRTMNMFLEKFKEKPQIVEGIQKYAPMVKEMKILTSMRVLQFAGDAVKLNNSRVYNCSFLHIKRQYDFAVVFYLLLSGCGVGFSVQRRHVDQLPPIQRNFGNWTKVSKSDVFVIPDTLEGWCQALDHLIASYMGLRPRVEFDYSLIRPKGSPLKTSGGIAPGPEPLRKALMNVEKILSEIPDGTKLRPIQIYDIICHVTDAVLAGGVRRSSCICLFDKTDSEMFLCKTKEQMWTNGPNGRIAKNPQRFRCNNSVVLERGKVTQEEFAKIWEVISQNGRDPENGSGEPGIFWTNDLDFGTNPCAEIALRDCQFCNLVEINMSTIVDQKDFEERCKAAAFFATLQATYTDFDFLPEQWKKVTEEEALIGVGQTGVASSIVMELDLKKGAGVVKETNEKIAGEVGINISARCTTMKPSGTTSLVLGVPSGVHAAHSRFYKRRIRINNTDPFKEVFETQTPSLIEPEQIKPDTDSVITIPMCSREDAITKDSETEIEFLNRVKYMFQHWILPGHRSGANPNNVSATNTIRYDQWENVGAWMWENRDCYTAIANLADDTNFYPQMPFEACSEEEYWRLCEAFSKIKFDSMVETEDIQDPLNESACDGLMCDISAHKEWLATRANNAGDVFVES